MSKACPPSTCETCAARAPAVRALGERTSHWDSLVALAGNPNTGKSTVFNRLTGLRQHTGNWPGKTITRAEGAFSVGERRYKLIDLPGTYSLLSTSPDEEVARDFLLFGRPHVTVVVVDATNLERNLNLVLQILQITSRVVVCLNLMDEARSHQLRIDARGLARDLGVAVVPCAARSGEGMGELLQEVEAVATGRFQPRPGRLELPVPGLQQAIGEIRRLLGEAFPGLPQPDWIALRLLHGDRRMMEAVRDGHLTALLPPSPTPESPPAEPSDAAVEGVLTATERWRWQLPQDFHDRLTESLYAEASRLAGRHCARAGQSQRLEWQLRLDRLLTSPWTGYPVMGLLFAVVLWLTIAGANVPSAWLARVLVDQGWHFLREGAAALGVWPWLAGVAIDGMYLTAAWVVSVMLPPMAIFFPIFTLLEDLGYLPRVAFNLDRLFHRAGAHGKQALTLAMGYGCNAAGVVATRIIDSPRERLIAILTNNFALCNGRWPTQILMATVFLGATVPPVLAGFAATGAVFAVAFLGLILTFLVSWLLSRTLLRGEASSFSLELPPFRPPNLWRTLYTSLLDRTLFVLWRAVVFAVPAGALIWLISNWMVGGQSLAFWMVQGLDPLGWYLGLTGVILVAYVVAIPANEIVVPTILMLTVLVTGQSGVGEAGTGVIFETSDHHLHTLLTAAGWSSLTAVCLMLFSLCHNPCSTTLYTIYKETASWRWTILAAVIPLVIGVVLCAAVAALWRMWA